MKRLLFTMRKKIIKLIKLLLARFYEQKDVLSILSTVLLVFLFAMPMQAQKRVLLDKSDNVIRADFGNGHYSVEILLTTPKRAEKDSEWVYHINGQDTIKYKPSNIDKYIGGFVSYNTWVGNFDGIDTDNIEYEFDSKDNKEFKDGKVFITKNNKSIRFNYSDGWYKDNNKIGITNVSYENNKLKIKFDTKINKSKSDSAVWSEGVTDDAQTVALQPSVVTGDQVTNYAGGSAADYEFMAWLKFDSLISDVVGADAIIDSSLLKVPQEVLGGTPQLYVATPVAGWSEATLNYGNQPDSSLAYLSDTLTAATIGVWWHFRTDTIVRAYYTGGALADQDTVTGYVILTPDAKKGAYNYIGFYTSESGAAVTRQVIYYTAAGAGAEAATTGKQFRVIGGVKQYRVKNGIKQPRVKN